MVDDVTRHVGDRLIPRNGDEWRSGSSRRAICARGSGRPLRSLGALDPGRGRNDVHLSNFGPNTDLGRRLDDYRATG